MAVLEIARLRLCTRLAVRDFLAQNTVDELGHIAAQPSYRTGSRRTTVTDDGNAREAITAYTGDRYTRHSTGAGEGIEGFAEFFDGFIERNPGRHIEIVRAIENGPYVFPHAYQSLSSGQTQWVTTGMFDTDGNDRIIEHGGHQLALHLPPHRVTH